MALLGLVTLNDLRLKGDTIALQTINSSFESNRILFNPRSRLTIKRVGIITATTLATSDTNYYTFQIINKGQSGSGTATILDTTGSVNTTKATGGSGLTGYVTRFFALNSANVTVNKDDVLTIVGTKTASPSDLTSSAFYIEWI